MTKHPSSPSLLIVLLFAALSMVFGTNVDIIQQYRHIVPRGTGPVTSSAALPSPTSPVLSSAATSETPSASPTDSSAPITSSEPSDSVIGSSDIASTSVTTPSSEPSSSPSTTVTSDSNPESQSSVTPATSTNIPVSASKTSKRSTTAPPIPVSSISQRVITTVLVTEGGTTHNSVVTRSELLPVSSAAPTSTSSPTVNGGKDSSSSSGLEPSQKRIIIGVVVGIGGAILLGGIAVVAWRIWGKRKHSADEDHELMDSQPGSSSLEKRSSVSGHSPFRSTLDQYHNPAGPVNTASNF